MANNISVLDSASAAQVVKTTDTASVHTPHHNVDAVIPGTGATSLGKAEDAAHASGDTGVQVLAVRTDTPAARSGTDGDYEPLQVSAGQLWARIADGSDAATGAVADAAATAGGTGTVSAKLRNATALLDSIKTAVETLGNAISGSEIQADVLTLPADPLGANADAAATAGSTGSISAKLRLATSQLDSIKTAVETLDNAISGSEMQVDVVGALPAGANAIGKLAANSGVDIGDVDVTSISAGENHVGQVSGHSDVADLTMSLDTSAYASGDVLADTQTVSVMRVNDGRGLLTNLTIIDEDDQGVAMTVWFLKSANSVGTENAAPSISDANARDILGWVPVATSDYLDLGGVKIACIRNIGLMLEAISGAQTVGVAMVNGSGTPTYTASGLKLKLGVLQD